MVNSYSLSDDSGVSGCGGYHAFFVRSGGVFVPQWLERVDRTWYRFGQHGLQIRKGFNGPVAFTAFIVTFLFRGYS